MENGRSCQTSLEQYNWFVFVTVYYNLDNLHTHSQNWIHDINYTTITLHKFCLESNCIVNSSYMHMSCSGLVRAPTLRSLVLFFLMVAAGSTGVKFSFLLGVSSQTKRLIFSLPTGIFPAKRSISSQQTSLGYYLWVATLCSYFVPPVLPQRNSVDKGDPSFGVRQAYRRSPSRNSGAADKSRGLNWPW